MAYVIRVVYKGSDNWLGRRVYLDYDAARIVRRNLVDNCLVCRYERVYVLPATPEQVQNANEVA